MTDRWIDLQARLRDRYDTRLIGGDVADGAVRQPHWLVAEDRLDLRLAYRWMRRSQGLTGAWTAGWLRRRPPVVIHAHYGPNAVLHRQMARLTGAALVASFYGHDATKAEYVEYWGRQYLKLFRDAGAVLAEGPAMAARVEALGCPAEKIHVVRMPADEEGLAECRGVKADCFLAVAAGRLIEKKGFDMAIRAFARSLRNRSDARLLIVGGGEQEASLRELAVSEGVDDQVVWGGRLPFRDFMAEISRAHVALYPSRTASTGDSEGGAPVTLIEAQWLGVPSIVSRHDDLPFVAAPGGSVVLPPLDVEGWAEALEALYADPGRLEGMAGRAESFAREHHAPAVNLRCREAVYDQAR